MVWLLCWFYVFRFGVRLCTYGLCILVVCNTYFGFSLIIDLNVIKKHVFKDHEKFVMNVKWSPDGKYFATCSRDGYITVYRLEDESLVFKVKVGSCVEAIEWTADSLYLIACSKDDSYMHYYNIETMEVEKYSMNTVYFISFLIVD